MELNGDVTPTAAPAHRPSVTDAGPHRAAMDAAMNTAMEQVRMQVTPENVLRVRAALLAESDRLTRALSSGGPPGDWVGLCGGDPLSADARTAFNQRIASVVRRCHDYAQRLRRAGASLDAVARGYGHTDEEIAASYRSAP